MDRDDALREVAQVYERIKLQQPLLFHHSSSPSPSPSPSTTTTTWLAHNLLGQALRALDVALSVTKQPAAALSGSGSGPPAVTPTPPPAELAKAEPGPGPGPGGGLIIPSNSSQERGSRSGKRPRSSSAIMAAGRNKQPSSTSSWVFVTTVPYEDGYEWRKYGEKKINGAGHTRSYFRCTYRDDTGCRATKHVQQRDGGGSDPPVFHVTYNGKHTCRSGGGSGGGVCCTATTTTSATGAIFVADSSMVAAAMVSMQQESLAAPAKTSTTSSCSISGDVSFSDYEYSAVGGVDLDMAARMAGVEEAPASADDDVPFSDFELFLLCNSFKDY